jgi:hypothetical protein
MAEVACFCGCLYSFYDDTGACPDCGEVVTLRTQLVPASTVPASTVPAITVWNQAEPARDQADPSRDQAETARDNDADTVPRASFIPMV